MMVATMMKRKETPAQTVERCLKWFKSPAGKRAIAKAARDSDQTREMFKQRPFTAEELNRRYRSPQTTHGDQ